MATTSNTDSTKNNDLDKITGFFTNKLDEAKYQLEARQRKFEISAAGSKLERKKANAMNWFDKEVVARADEANKELQKLKKGETTNRNENELRRAGEGEIEGCGVDFNFDCSNPCGLFSTTTTTTTD